MFRKNMGWILSMTVASSLAHGQYMGGGAGIQASLYAGAQGQWGGGYYGAMQPCMVRAGAGAISQSDEMHDIKERQKEIREELAEKKRELRGLSTKTRRAEATLRTFLVDDALADIKLHVTAGRQCNEWTGKDGTSAKGPSAEADKEKKVESAPPVSGKKDTTVDNRVEPEKLLAFSYNQWGRACANETGNRRLNNYEVCNMHDGILVTAPKKLHVEDQKTCIENMGEYQKSILDRDRLSKEIA